jgi:uncharacterized protein
MSAGTLLNLGTIISKGESSLDASFFLEEDEVESFQINPDLIVTGRTCVIGSSGSGKSYTVGVICEELCKSKVPFVIVDIEGEYSGLKEKFPVIWVGNETKSDIRWKDKIDLKMLAQKAPDLSPIVFDLSEASRPREKVNEFLIELYREISRRRTPYLIILEEADRFSPQVGDRLPIFDEIARRGRKRGLGLMLCTQRPSLVDKNILSQCSNQLIGKLVIKNDLSSVAQFFSAGRGPPNQLTTLTPGEFFALGGIVPEPEKVKIRARETRHGGMTPKLKQIEVPPTTGKILETVQASVTASAVEETALKLPEKQVTAVVVPDKVETSVAIPEEEETAVVELPPVVPKTDDEDLVVEAPSFETEEADSDTEAGEEEEFEAFNPETVDSDPSKVLGLAPMIQRESVPGLVKLEKTYKLFGQKENVTDVALVFRPVMEVGVRIRSGILKKKFDTKYFLLDGMSGKLAEVTDRLSIRSGLEKLLSLNEGHIQILKVLYPDRDLTLIEIAGAAKREVEEARRLLKLLEERRLVRSTKIGRAKGYRRLLDLPRIELVGQPLLKLNELNPSDGFKLSKVRIKEAQVREVVKGMWEGADVDSFRQIYYPVYVAEIILNGRTRHVWIDGRTGREIEI